MEEESLGFCLATLPKGLNLQGQVIKAAWSVWKKAEKLL